jgi:uncharacterized repeat protein (TIGR02543 family)
MIDSLLKNHINRLIILVSVFLLGTVGINLLYTKSVSADWFSELGKTYTVYEKGGTLLYWNEKGNTWVITSTSIPQVHFNGISCDTGDSNMDFDQDITYWNCSGLVITAHTQSAWFDNANLAYRIGDFDSHETASVTGGRITNKGSLNQVTIASNGKSASSASSGCSGGNPNMTEACSILVVFNNSYGEGFKLTLGRTDGGSGHEYYYTHPSVKNYHTLTFDPNGGSVVDTPDSIIWSHTNGADVLREYVKNDVAKNYPTPTWDANHTFQGWYNSAGKKALSTHTMDGDVTYYAHWALVPSSGYTLTPNISVTPSVIDAGATLYLNASIVNPASSNKTSGLTTWSVTRVPATTGLPSGSFTGLAPGATFTIPAFTDSDTDYPVGTTLTYTLTVTPGGQQNGTNLPPAIATAQAIIGISPKVDIQGGDLIVGKDVNTSTSTKSGTTYGSWAEYGIIASGGISGAASGAAFAGPGMTGYTLAKASALSFANTNVDPNCSFSSTLRPTTGGCYKPNAIPSIIAASFPVTSTTFASGSNIDLSSGTIPSGTYSATGTVTITGGNNINKSIIINAPDATVNITGDIRYDTGANLSSISDIPQVVIIAKNINIADVVGANTVTNIDAWLIAQGGTINTCSDVDKDANLSTDICKDKLTVNGPVMTDKLYLRRTAGSGTGANSGDPAEVFNLPASAYLWSITQASKSKSNVQTVYSTELPPRF